MKERDSLNKYYKRYEKIVKSNMKSDSKDRALSALMTDMEHEYHIPLYRDKQWEQNNKSAISLYRIISKSRSL